MRSLYSRMGTSTPFLAAGVLLVAGLGLAGCGGDSVGPSGNSTTLARAVNGLQGCPTAVDIEQLNVQPVPFPNLAYAMTSGNYASLRAGTGLHYAVFPTGQAANGLATADVDLNPHDPNGDPNSGTYTLAAAGICGGGTGITTPHLIRLIDAFPSTFNGNNNGTVALRVINLVPDVGGGISLASNGAALHGTSDAATNNVPYVATPGYNTSNYNQGINLAGAPTLTIRTNANTVLATVPNFNFQANHAYTLFVFGEVTPTGGGQPISVLPVVDF